MRYRPDRSTRSLADGRIVLGGSPLRLFRLSAAGARAMAAILTGADVTRSAPIERLVDRLVDAGAIHPVAPAPVHGPGDVTVVVPAWRATTDRLATIAAASPGVATVIGVDDGSPTPLVAPPGVRVIRREVNGGPGAARNTGLALVDTALVAFVDTDVTPDPGWLDGLLGHFADDRVAVVAPRVAADGSGRVAAYEHRHSPLDLGPDPARVAPDTRVAYVPAAALVARTGALRSLGGFDETLPTGEDVDLVWRTVAAGHRVRYEPAVVVRHDARPTWAALVRQRIGYGASAAPLAQRHPGALAPVRMNGWTAVVWALLGLGRPRLATGVAVTTAIALVRRLPGVPAATSLWLALTGHALAGRQLADAARRVWWPVVLPATFVSRRVRRLAVAAVLDGLAHGGPARLLDDAAYGLGVWRGVVATGTTAPLCPAVTPWPPGDTSTGAGSTNAEPTSEWYDGIHDGNHRSRRSGRHPQGHPRSPGPRRRGRARDRHRR